MAAEIPARESMSRPEAIELLRSRLEAMTDPEHCLCDVAGRLGILCKGFRDLSDGEFRRRFDWIARKRPNIPRPELERLVSLYHSGREEVAGARLCCDVETREHCACDGWNAFDNRDLERFCRDIAGRDVRIL
jgi:hypothetical protein